MNQYRRIVSYLYQYLNGEKGQNIGYARLEQKGRQCRVTVQMRPVETSFMPEVWLFKQGKTAIEYISLGRLSAHSGSLQLKIVTSAEDVCSSGHTASDFDGAVVYINDRQYYATTWTNESIYIGNKINMSDKNAYNKSKEDLNSKDNRTDENNEINNITSAIKEDNKTEDNADIEDETKDNTQADIPAGKDNTNADKDIVQAAVSSNGISSTDNNNSIEEDGKDDSRQDIQEPDIRTQDIEENKQSYGCSACPYKNYDKKNEDFGVRILRNFPVMYPFRSGDIEESVRIEPKDIGCMPIRLWSFANNRFLLHGYYCYKHLIFAKLCNGHYALGVPGVYSEQESKRAASFSFTGFQPVGPGKTVYGVFGYWITEVNI